MSGHRQEGLNNLNNRTIYLALVATSAIAVSALAPAQTKTIAENGLGSIKLYDPGIKLIQLYGSPLDIEAIGVGGGAVGPAGGGGRMAGPMGGPMGGPPGAMGGRAGGGAPMPSAGPGGGAAGAPQMAPDFSIGEWLGDQLSNRQMGAPGGRGGQFGGSFPPNYQGGPPPGLSGSGPNAGGMAGQPGTLGPSGGRMAGPTGPGGMGPMGPGGPGAGPQMGATATNRVVFTRWVYKRQGTKFGYVLDKQNRVVEIEAIALSNPSVKTRRSIGFGSTFGDIIKKYGSPDAYEIGGNTLVMRYLVRYKVAFRLNRLGVDKPHRVTGIVVAAGKS